MANGGTFTTVRAFYRKEGRIKYISHLDMNRCISRALRRSGLPVWHTLGFNPHIYITFALPLSLGYESICESFDFRLISPLPMEEVTARLNAVLPEGLTVTQTRPAVQKPEAIVCAHYEMTLEYDGLQAAEVLEKLEKWCARPEIPVLKKTKKGETTIDAKPHFGVLSATANGNTLALGLSMAAGTSFNLNPTLLFDTFATETGCAADWIRVVRTAVLDENGAAFA